MTLDQFSVAVVEIAISPLTCIITLLMEHGSRLIANPKLISEKWNSHRKRRQVCGALDIEFSAGNGPVL